MALASGHRSSYLPPDPRSSKLPPNSGNKIGSIRHSLYERPLDDGRRERSDVAVAIRYPQQLRGAVSRVRRPDLPFLLPPVRARRGRGRPGAGGVPRGVSEPATLRGSLLRGHLALPHRPLPLAAPPRRAPARNGPSR